MDALDEINLPIVSILDSVCQALAESACVIVTAAPGAGKSTVLPLRLASYRILMLEPRRIAARQVACRMAELLGEPVGETVGFRTRYETKISARTRIEVVTEGILTRKLIKDPTLDGYDIVIFDEFHERNLHSDLGLALVREAQRLVRDDLKILIMSATIDSSSIAAELSAPVLHSEGRAFSVETHYTSDELTDVIHRAYKEHVGDILVFLPGEREIRELSDRLASRYTVYPLYGQLSPAEQQRAIAPSAPGLRKIVLSTPVAETSVTIEGIRVVIDSGLCRRPVVDAQTGLTRLETVQISCDMADQRRGRAGRVAEGVCYRLWSVATEQRMAPHRVPEILEADLSGMLLDIAAWGGRVEDLQWLTPPDNGAVARARQLLRTLGALDTENRITETGRRMVQIPAHPRLQKMRLMALSDVEKRLAEHIIDVLDGGKGGRWDDTDYAVGRLLAAAYPERIARAMGNGQFRLASGLNARLDEDSLLMPYPWIVVAEMNATSGRVFRAAAVAEQDLRPYTYTTDRVGWDSKSSAIVARREWRIGNLCLETRPLTDCTPEQLTAAVVEAAPKDGLSMFDFADESVVSLQQRVATLAAWHPELQLPDLTTDFLLQHAETWYTLSGTRVGDLKRYPLADALRTLLTYDQLQLLDRLLPTHITVPTGSRIRVEYRVGAELPVLRVRLQECFGLMDTPRVDDGRRPVLMELLSPGYKPVQLTSDLRSFWTTTYFEVRKELRRRYPKHAWPDDPIAAVPQTRPHRGASGAA